MKNLSTSHVRPNITPADHLIHMREHTDSTHLLSAKLISHEMVAYGLTVAKSGYSGDSEPDRYKDLRVLDL